MRTISMLRPDSLSGLSEGRRTIPMLRQHDISSVTEGRGL